MARAFAGEGRILVLDEPSSFLDPDAEERLFGILREHFGDRTILFVSHRFSTVRQADWIYVMENGAVAEQGAHEELMGRAGLYARMFELQAKGYRA